MRYKKTIYFGLALLLIFFVLVGSCFRSDYRDQRSQSSGFSNQGMGVSFFQYLGNQMTPNSVALSGRPFTSAAELSPYKTIAFLGPGKSLRQDQKEIFLEFLKKGGNFILSFEDEYQKYSFDWIFSELQLELNIEKRKDFKNQKLEILSPSATSSLFRSKEKYAFYSKYKFSNSNCEQHAFDCYVYHYHHPKTGSDIWVLLGLPFFSNALIEQADNRLASFSLLNEYSSLLLEEYTHFFSDYDFFKLLKQARFFYPFVGFMLLIVLFFFFSNAMNDFDDDQSAAYKAPLTFHEFNENLLFGVLNKPAAFNQALSEQEKFMAQIFPREKANIQSLFQQKGLINKAEDFLKEAKKRILFHQKMLKKEKS